MGRENATWLMSPVALASTTNIVNHENHIVITSNLTAGDCGRMGCLPLGVGSVAAGVKLPLCLVSNILNGRRHAGHVHFIAEHPRFDRLPKFINLNTKSIIFDAKFIIIYTKSIILNKKSDTSGDDAPCPTR